MRKMLVGERCGLCEEVCTQPRILPLLEKEGAFGPEILLRATSCHLTQLHSHLNYKLSSNVNDISQVFKLS
jgi:hypothetical protein